MSEASIASIEHRLDIVRTNGGVLAASATGDRILTVDVPALISHCRAQAAETARLKAELARKDEALRELKSVLRAVPMPSRAWIDGRFEYNVYDSMFTKWADRAKAALSAEDDALAEGGEG